MISRMLNLKRRYESLWDPSLRRLRDDDLCPETFDEWWHRHSSRLSNLHPEIAEQWIHRHWSSTPYQFLRLETLQWRKETWRTERVLSEVHLEFGGPVHRSDYDLFRGGPGSLGPIAAARNWRNGSWELPIVILEIPSGIDTYDGPLPDVRFVVIEGSKRYRYLWAANYHSVPTGPHELYILTTPDVG